MFDDKAFEVLLTSKSTAGSEETPVPKGNVGQDKSGTKAQSSVGQGKSEAKAQGNVGRDKSGPKVPSTFALRNIAGPPAGTKLAQTYGVAYAIKRGKAHANDTRELALRLNERLTIDEDLDVNWVIAKNMRGERGFVHKSFLSDVQRDPSSLYLAWQTTCKAAFQAGNLVAFPAFPVGANVCVRLSCQATKTRKSLGICGHDLQYLLSGAEEYAVAMIKDERNKWHPDRFTRFCHPAASTELSDKASQLFVLLSDLLEQAGQADGAGRGAGHGARHGTGHGAGRSA